MRAVAYCRVSTNKEEQLDSLDAQQKFFAEYALRNQLQLVRIYADEGKSGTKMKNRTELLRLLADAGRDLFETVLIKDVSRLARNTVDFLTSIRKLKTLGVRVVFVNYDQTSSDSSEFMLTMLSAIAQEESANTSKRVKFGKRINMEKGRVPNLIYGYDKIPGDYFNLIVNEREAAVVRTIFDLYVRQNMGTHMIAQELNSRGQKTKRGCDWSQNAICRLLTNELYAGEVINGKEEVEDFLTGKRKGKQEEDWFVVPRPDLAIVDPDTYRQAAEILAARKSNFQATGQRRSEKHLFSKLIQCGCCGATFRRTVRTYRNTYIKWVCAGRNANGADACPNDTVLDEEELLNGILQYFTELLRNGPHTTARITAEFRRAYQTAEDTKLSEKALTAQQNKLRKTKERYLEMYAADIITLEELQEKTGELNASLNRLARQLSLMQHDSENADPLDGILSTALQDIGSLLSSVFTDDAALSQVIGKIEVDHQRNVDVYLKPLASGGPGKTVPLNDIRT